MKLSTTHQFNTTPDKLWPLLFSSKMDDKQPCYFLCGLPKPVECRLKGEEGKAGTMRECVSDKGIITQEILEWQPNKRLQFRLKETNLYFGPCVRTIVEDFQIEALNNQQSIITRTTDFELVPGIKYFASIPMCIGLKAIHHYVFKNWKRLSAS
ncbi:MAG TPA: hypothetical protein VMR70_10295 [Flavisolibacter sp.]|nr:hypothetical protein [Flavisolibacter sp.]